MGQQQVQTPHDGRVEDPLAEGGSAHWNVRSVGKYIESDAGEYAGDISRGLDCQAEGPDAVPRSWGAMRGL